MRNEAALVRCTIPGDESAGGRTGELATTDQQLAEATTAVADIFTETDSELARALTAEAPPSRGAAGPM